MAALTPARAAFLICSRLEHASDVIRLQDGRYDGTIVTVCHSSELHVSRRPRPKMLGVDGAAALYRPEGLP